MRLMRAGAVSAATAQPLDGLRWPQERRLKRLLGRGVVHESQSGRYYLDPPALADDLTARRRRALFVAAVIVGMMGLLSYFGWSSVRF